MFYEQTEFDIRCEWGIEGVEMLSLFSDVTIIVDTMSFSTCVDIAVQNGALVFPYRWKDDTAIEYAKLKNAELASFERQSGQFSLSPLSLVDISANIRIVLPSPNGSTLSLASKSKHTITGCLRNYMAVAEHAMQLGNSVLVVPAGEKWQNGTLRPAVEDLVAAGAIISQITGTKSPEAKIAQSTFEAFQDRLPSLLLSCSSGKELCDRGFEQDIELIAQLNCSNVVPKLQNEAYVNCNIVEARL